MSDNDPVNLSILELLNANFTGESTVGLVEDILGSNANLGVGSLAGEEEVESGGGDDDLDGGVELGLVEVLTMEVMVSVTPFLSLRRQCQ